MLETLVCTNDWLNADKFNLYRDPTDYDLDLYREIEEIEKSKCYFMNRYDSQVLSTTSSNNWSGTNFIQQISSSNFF